MGLASHSLRKKGFTGSRRAYEKSAFRKLGSDRRVLAGIFQKIHDLLKGFLGLILSGHILEGYAGLFLGINLGFVFSHAHNSAATGHFSHDKTEGHPDKNEGDHQT